MAADLSGSVAHLGDDGARIQDKGGAVLFTVDLSKPIPWKVHTLGQPARLIVDFAQLEWSKPPIIASNTIGEVRTGIYRPGWSRFVAILREPLNIDTAEMATQEDGTAVLSIVLRPTTAENFRATVGAAATEIDDSGRTSPPLPSDDGRLRIVLDPGHGGIDPGAEADGLVEADLMLSFARDLKETLLRTERFDVVLTRNEDVFVPLEERLTIARTAGADVFLSLHADALEADAGPASGMTVYTLSDEVTDRAALRLAERHAQNDILAGVDLSGTEDEVAFILLDIARRDTTPRSEALAGFVVSSVLSAGLPANSRPHRYGGFSVLKSAEVPSALIELGFLSSVDDRIRLSSDEWRIEASLALRDALLRWWDEDKLRSQSLKR